jgi:chorismate synthase
VRCLDPEASAAMVAAIDDAKARRDTLGGVVEVRAFGLPPGVGTGVVTRERLDARLAGGLMSVPAIKGVEIGGGFALAARPGSEVHDEIHHEPEHGFVRPTNNAGGIEGGMTNGEPVVARAAMKPLATLMRPMRSVDTATLEPADALLERSDVCAVPAAGVVCEAVVAYELARAMRFKFGGDHLDDMRAALDHYRARLPG